MLYDPATCLSTGIYRPELYGVDWPLQIEMVIHIKRAFLQTFSYICTENLYTNTYTNTHTRSLIHAPTYIYTQSFSYTHTHYHINDNDYGFTLYETRMKIYIHRTISAFKPGSIMVKALCLS